MMKPLAILIFAGMVGAQTAKPICPPNGCSGGTVAKSTAPKAVQITLAPDALDGVDKSRIDLLTNEEYDRLQKLRQAVADAEKEIAKAHGVQLELKQIYEGSHTCLATSLFSSCDNDRYSYPDTYEFRGQFLLINVPKPSPQSGGGK